MATETKFDFSGYATKAGLKCSDGRTIMKDAFKHQDGAKVPLVWQHSHDKPANVLGHAVLENREDGVYCYGKFNDTPDARIAKQLVAHGDITFLSIYASQLKEKALQVMHGAIREISLVISGANPGARIDNLSFTHGDGSDYVDETEAFLTTGIAITHTDDLEHSEKTIADVFATFTEEQQAAVVTMIIHALGDDEDPAFQHAEDDNMTIAEIFNTLNEQQKKMVYYLVSELLSEKSTVEHAEGDGDLKNNKKGDSDNMKHNVFDKGTTPSETTKVLTHAEFGDIIGGIKRYGSLKESFLAHAKDYGFDPIDILFPDARLVRPGAPDTIKRDDTWVAGVLSETNHTPFSRIKTRIADLTADEARAKGYVTGNRKVEEIITLMKRITTPTTIYKKQKLDRDDLVDITDFDVVVWLKAEMQAMLKEELGRAILIGDGRSVSDQDKINEQNIRPIATDDDTVFVHRAFVGAGLLYDEIIDEVIRSREHYRGSGSPTLYTTTELVTNMLLIKDLNQRRIYASLQELSSVLRVSKIVEVEAMNNATAEFEGTTYKILGIVVNLRDYTIGADKGGEINMFDDFDIDYNQNKYLVETRVSGALTVPKSAIVILQPTAG